VILAFVASRFLCFATKSSDPPKQKGLADRTAKS
jgi:hypothetical protein